MPEWLSTAVICAVIIVICVFAVISYTKKLSKGCCGTATDEVKKIRATGSYYGYHYAVEVGGMTCPKCVVNVENAFNRQGGIRADADLKSGVVQISSEKPLSEIIIRKTIIDIGYSVGDITEK